MARRATKSELVVATLAEVARNFHRMRAVGHPRGVVTNWGGGLFGMIRALKLDGPMTVPQIARSLPVARQLIQRLADEAAADGLVEFVANPAHKRSKLVQLTDKGEAYYQEKLADVLSLGGVWSSDIDAESLRITVATLKALGEEMMATIDADGAKASDGD